MKKNHVISRIARPEFAYRFKIKSVYECFKAGLKFHSKVIHKNFGIDLDYYYIDKEGVYGKSKIIFEVRLFEGIVGKTLEVPHFAKDKEFLIRMCEDTDSVPVMVPKKVRDQCEIETEWITIPTSLIEKVGFYKECGLFEDYYDDIRYNVY